MEGTHTPDELVALEQDTGLQFAGWLHEGRCVLPILLKPEHFERRRAIILAFNTLCEGEKRYA